MKKIISACIMIFAFMAVYSQTIPAEHQLLRTSGFAVHAAHKYSIANNTSTLNLGKCIEHQKFAVIQYKTGNKTTAIYHSAYARRLAFVLIEKNGGKINASFDFTPEELNLLSGSPSDQDLDNALSVKSFNDADYLNPQLTGVDL